MTSMIGPWTAADHDSFLRLGERIGPVEQVNRLAQLYVNAGSLLPGSIPASNDYETLVDAWRARTRHPVYKWLEANENFRAAWATFQKHRRRAKTGKLAEPIADLVFLRLVVSCAGRCFLSKTSDSRRRGAVARTRRSAIRHSSALINLFKEGISLHSYPQQGQLESLLQRLNDELRAQRRKRYEGHRITGTRALEFFALDAVMHLDLRSPAIVHDIANMAGISRERSTCERYVKAAAEQWRKAIAEALRAPQKTNQN